MYVSTTTNRRTPNLRRKTSYLKLENKEKKTDVGVSLNPTFASLDGTPGTQRNLNRASQHVSQHGRSLPTSEDTTYALPPRVSTSHAWSSQTRRAGRLTRHGKGGGVSLAHVDASRVAYRQAHHQFFLLCRTAVIELAGWSP